MKILTLVIVVLLLGIERSNAQQQSTENSIDTTAVSVLQKTQGKRFSKKPILKSFSRRVHKTNKHFGDSVDQAMLTRNIAALLKYTAFLDSLETVTMRKSTQLTSTQLLDTTVTLMVNTPRYIGVSEDYTTALTLAKKLNAPEIQKYLLAQELIAPPAAPSPPPGMGKSRGTPARGKKLMNITNSSRKVLYIYVENEYKGILYAGKSMSLQELNGCKELSAETVDLLRTSKKYCFDTTSAKEWIIK